MFVGVDVDVVREGDLEKHGNGTGKRIGSCFPSNCFGEVCGHFSNSLVDELAVPLVNSELVI